MSKPTVLSRFGWFGPSLLLVLTIVPIIAGVARLVWLATGEIRPDSARFAAMPAPLVLHILSVSIFGVLGAFQFAPGIRGRWPRWHRAAGRILVPAGLVVAVTALWMTLLYRPGVNDGEVLHVIRLVFGSAMVASLLLGMDAVRRRDFASHSAWMTRAYAIGMGAGTQVVVFVPWVLLVGPIGELSRALLMGAGWVLNLAVAEWLLFRGKAQVSLAHRQAPSQVRRSAVAEAIPGRAQL